MNIKPDYIIDNCLTLEKLSKEANLIFKKVKIFDHNYFNNFVVISLELLIFIWIKKVEKSKWILTEKNLENKFDKENSINLKNNPIMKI